MFLGDRGVSGASRGAGVRLNAGGVGGLIGFKKRTPRDRSRGVLSRDDPAGLLNGCRVPVGQEDGPADIACNPEGLATATTGGEPAEAEQRQRSGRGHDVLTNEGDG